MQLWDDIWRPPGSRNGQMSADTHAAGVDDLRLGRTIRMARIRKGWRQRDLADAAGTSRGTISNIERGHVGTLSLDLLRRVAAALEIRLDLNLRWRGGDLDRMVASRHSQLHEAFARTIASEFPVWAAVPEVSFNVWGERGVIDLILLHEPRRTLLIVEFKTELVDLNELLGTMDRRRRLAPHIARERQWAVDTVSAWIVVAVSRTNQRRIAAHDAMLRAAYPAGDRDMRTWLRDPQGSIAALSTWRADPATARAVAPISRVRSPVP